MHPNPAFRDVAQEKAIAFARQRGFGILSINGADGPLSAHIPFVLTADARSIHAHLVASNALYRALPLDQDTPALLSVSGPDSYISPDWYGVDDQVPTWNYIAVNLRGQVRRAPQDQLHDYLAELSDAFEARLAPKPVWRMDKLTPEVAAKMMRQIRPISIEISAVESTFKLGQNKPVAARLSASGHVGEHGIGQEVRALQSWMADPEQPI